MQQLEVLLQRSAPADQASQSGRPCPRCTQQIGVSFSTGGKGVANRATVKIRAISPIARFHQPDVGWIVGGPKAFRSERSPQSNVDGVPTWSARGCMRMHNSLQPLLGCQSSSKSTSNPCTWCPRLAVDQPNAPKRASQVQPIPWRYGQPRLAPDGSQTTLGKQVHYLA